MKRRLADIIMDILVDNSITDCFAVVGGGAMHLDNALALNNKIHKYFNHHEQACAMAAEAYARLSGKMAAVCVTSGPGATNTITGVMGAWQDSLPLIVLSGQVRYEISVAKSGLPLRYRGIQEFEVIPAAKTMTKYAVMLTNPLAVKREMHKAISIAMEGRRGPVWIDVPQDIQNAMVDEDELYPIEEEGFDYAEADYNRFAQLIKEAKRPCFLAGTGIISGDARDKFISFAEKIQVPVIAGGNIADAMYMEHPLFFGLSGTVGPRTGNFILQNADLIIAFGDSMGYRQTGFNVERFAPKAKLVMVDADKHEAQKPGIRVELLINRPLNRFFDEIENVELSQGVSEKWMGYCNMLKNRFSAFEAITDIKMDDRISSYYFWKIFDEYQEEDSICALGNNTANTAKLQVGTSKKNQRVLTNYTCGSMGYDLPCAIGAAVASHKKVYCITGDGSIMMNLQELQTIRYYDLPVAIVVFSNDGYAAIRQTSKNFFNGVCIGCTKDTGISFPDFADVAKTFGFKYMKCSTNAELEKCVKWFINSKERVLLEIEQMFDNPVVPKLMSRLDENGKMQSPVLHDMAPLLPKEEIDILMIAENADE
jgi:acetolactate synthase-1/2/3 large subunit